MILFDTRLIEGFLEEKLTYETISFPVGAMITWISPSQYATLIDYDDDYVTSSDTRGWHAGWAFGIVPPRDSYDSVYVRLFGVETSVWFNGAFRWEK